MQTLIVILTALIAASCGKSGSSAGLPVVRPKIIPADGSNIQGLYMAKFITLNGHVVGTIPGSATIQRKNDEVYAYVRLFGGAPNGWHQQDIHEGTRCPGPQDDLNQDGYIDFQEGEKVYGKVLIPLDSNINSQNSGRSIYPVADASGSYFYERVGSFKSMFRDLKSNDKNLADRYIKIPQDLGLDLEGKVVVVHGTQDTVVYPETVASADGRPVHQTLPIACGTFSPVTRIPGETYNDEAPLPHGEVGPTTTTDTAETEPEEPARTPSDERDPEYDGRRPRPERERSTPWYDRIIDWWRSTWERERGTRRQSWARF